MKKSNKILAVIFAAVMAAATLCFSACGSSSSGGSSKKSGSGADTSNVDIVDFSYGFIAASEYTDTTTVSDTKKLTSLDAGTSYYLIVNFQIASREDNIGTSLLTVDVELDDIDVMTGTIAESNGISVPMEFVNASTGKNSLSYTTDFKIPDQASVPKTVYIVMELIPVTTGQSHVYIKLSAEDFLIYGSDGFTRDLTINPVQLESPVLNWTENTMTLTWNQIQYADYYVFYVDDALLKDSSGAMVYVEADPNIKVGDDVYYTKIYNYTSGYRTVRVQAISYTDIFTASSYSNAVTIDI